jgi:hypothetical protein
MSEETRFPYHLEMFVGDTAWTVPTACRKWVFILDITACRGRIFTLFTGSTALRFTAIGAQLAARQVF